MPKKKKYNVELRGKAYMRGVITVTAASEQLARAAAWAAYMENGIEWKYVEEDDDYSAQIVDVDPV